MEVLCSGEFSSEEEREVLEAYCISYPLFGNKYSIREFVKNPDGTYGILLNEIYNPPNIDTNLKFHCNSGEYNWNMRNFKMVDKIYRLKYHSLWHYYKNSILYPKHPAWNVKPATETIE